MEKKKIIMSKNIHDAGQRISPYMEHNHQFIRYFTFGEYCCDRTKEAPTLYNIKYTQPSLIRSPPSTGHLSGDVAMVNMVLTCTLQHVINMVTSARAAFFSVCF